MLVKRAAHCCRPASSRGGRPAVRWASALATAGVLQKALAAAATNACADQHAARAAHKDVVSERYVHSCRA